MDYNLAKIRNRVLVDKLDDDEFDPQVVDNFINDAQRDIFNTFELPFMEKMFSGSIPTGAIIFNMPEDVALPQSQVVTAPDGKQVDMMPNRLDFRTFNSMYPTPGNNAAGSVNRWASYAGRVLLDRPTDQEYTMTIFYIKKPKTLAQDTDIPEIPEEFEELLVLGALMRIHDRNEDTDLKQNAEAEYSRQLLNMVNRYGYRIADGPIKMKNQQR